MASYSIASEWGSVDSLESLQDVMHSFLNGEIKHTPWHSASLDNESKLIHSELIALNGKGIIPINSQPGMTTLKGYKQRAYLEALVLPEVAEKLENLRNFYFVSSTPNTDSSLKDEYTTPVSKGLFKTYTFQPGSDGPQASIFAINEMSNLSVSSRDFYHSLFTVSIVEKKWASNLMWSDILKTT